MRARTAYMETSPRKPVSMERPATASTPEGAPMSGSARLIALDWGTTSLRAFLLGDGGTVIDVVALPQGIMAVTSGGFAAALDAATGAWKRRDPTLPMVAAGMIGSAQGWREIAYVDCPAGMGELVSAIKQQAASGC